MSQFRLARISLILAATLGMNAVPALLPAAFAAQDKPAAEAPKGDSIRPEMFKLLDPAKVKDLLAGKKYAEVQANITAAEAFPNRSSYEDYIIDRMKLALGAGTGDEKMSMAALEAVINSERAPKSDQLEFIQALGNSSFNAKDYPKAIEWYKRYQKEAPDPSKVRRTMAKAYYLTNDFTNSKQELDKLVADAEAAGSAPALDDLRLQASAAAKLKDMNAYTVALEKLVAFYPSDDFWTDLLRRMQSKPTFSNRLQLDVFRLEMLALKEMAPEEYTEMAELALQGGYFTEAKNAMDAGFAKGVLGKGSSAAKHKQLHERATKGAADDAKTIAAGEAAAQAAKSGLPMVNLGYAYVTMDQFDKGIPMMEKGIAKGGLKNADDAKLHLAVAYAKAGRKADAIKALEGLKGNDGMTELARYWTMYLKGPAAPVAAAAPAPSK